MTINALFNLFTEAKLYEHYSLLRKLKGFVIRPKPESVWLNKEMIFLSITVISMEFREIGITVVKIYLLCSKYAMINHQTNFIIVVSLSITCYTNFHISICSKPFRCFRIIIKQKNDDKQVMSPTNISRHSRHTCGSIWFWLSVRPRNCLCLSKQKHKQSDRCLREVQGVQKTLFVRRSLVQACSFRFTFSSSYRFPPAVTSLSSIAVPSIFERKRKFFPLDNALLSDLIPSGISEISMPNLIYWSDSTWKMPPTRKSSAKLEGIQWQTRCSMQLWFSEEVLRWCWEPSGVPNRIFFKIIFYFAGHRPCKMPLSSLATALVEVSEMMGTGR